MDVWQNHDSKLPAAPDPLPSRGRTDAETSYRGGARHAAAGRSGPSGYLMPPTPDDAALVKPRTTAPASGWRRSVHSWTGGRIRPADSRAARRQAERIDLISRPIDRDHRIAVLSLKGGVGKTTTTLGLGAAFAAHRSDRVIVVDGRPDGGTLAQRAHEKSASTIGGLLRDAGVTRYSHVRSYTRMATNRLEVLANEPDPAVGDVLDEHEYQRMVEAIQKYYTLILTDCGPGIINPTMAGVLTLADALVIVTSPSLDAVRSASVALKWLTLRGYSDLARDSVLVVNTMCAGAPPIRPNKIHEHFRAMCRSIHDIPYDSHLAQGGEFDVDLLQSHTRDAYVEVAAALAGRLPPPDRPEPPWAVGEGI